MVYTDWHIVGTKKNLLSECINRFYWFSFLIHLSTVFLCPFSHHHSPRQGSHHCSQGPSKYSKSFLSPPSSLYSDSTVPPEWTFWSCLLFFMVAQCLGIKSVILSVTLKALHNQVSNNFSCRPYFSLLIYPRWRWPVKHRVCNLSVLLLQQAASSPLLHLMNFCLCFGAY